MKNKEIIAVNQEELRNIVLKIKRAKVCECCPINDLLKEIMDKYHIEEEPETLRECLSRLEKEDVVFEFRVGLTQFSVKSIEDFLLIGREELLDTLFVKSATKQVGTNQYYLNVSFIKEPPRC